MSYIVVGLILISWGLSLISSETGFLPGSRLPVVFGEYKDIAGVVFTFAGLWLTTAGWKALKNGKGL
ncbi:hypothetical protein QAA18_09155 [Luteimonas sp. 8-5]|uniref:hypothetical protein n=1 Tax=Luteimonas sp. 8-5 TaxID=3039387 RepID=UPI0024372F20|nr:hypothetical protein [Luteimonas sp. 8-5]MDG6348901.1 hypothetical protein [Luteimonas sp. 8-5]